MKARSPETAFPDDRPSRDGHAVHTGAEDIFRDWRNAFGNRPAVTPPETGVATAHAEQTVQQKHPCGSTISILIIWRDGSCPRRDLPQMGGQAPTRAQADAGKNATKTGENKDIHLAFPPRGRSQQQRARFLRFLSFIFYRFLRSGDCYAPSMPKTSSIFRSVKTRKISTLDKTGDSREIAVGRTDRTRFLSI